LGFDTSNYTTSVAFFDGKRIIQKKKLLEVKAGERGLRQSDAVFQHTVNMPSLIQALTEECDFNAVQAVAVSTRPRNVDGSYMPCFLVGEANAVSVSSIAKAPIYKTSHQVGHILAALYSIERLDLINEPFVAFHVSGGTTEALLVTPDEEEIIKAELIAESTDLKAGQAIDRAGVMMGLKFPCGAELDKLAQNSNREFKIKPSMKDLNCSLSGVENKAKKMFESNERNEDIAKFVVSFIAETLSAMTQGILDKYGKMPVVFAGGVSSNSMLKEKLGKKFNAYFAKPEFSCDNAAGIAIYAYLKSL
ncbi:MAG: peptidase M22, partial [Eubacterium sp.]|nr:peptidase M22 [Eubacterium sp.]